jgi:hypothetical protein
MGLNWLSSASNVTDYWLVEQGSIPDRSRKTTSRPVPGPTQPHIQWVPCVTVADCDIDGSSASSSNVTNAWSCTLITPVCAFVTYAQRQLYHNISSVYSCKLSSSFFMSRGWDHLWTAASNGHIVHPPDDMWVHSIMVEWYWQGNPEELGEKPVPVPVCSPQVPHGLVSAVRVWRLTAWATLRPSRFISFIRFHTKMPTRSM